MMIQSKNGFRFYQQSISWQQLKHGKWIQASIQARLDEYTSQFFGQHLLKLGQLSYNFSFTNSFIHHQINCDRYKHPENHLLSNFEQLPFISKSIDLTLLIHQLEFSLHPHQMIKEMDRVTMDDGYLVITGSAPIVSFGLNKYEGKFHYRLPCYRLLDWLHLLNYEIITYEIYSVLPEIKLDKPLYVKGLLHHFWGLFERHYFILAQKKSYPLNSIHSNWKMPIAAVASISYPKDADKGKN